MKFKKIIAGAAAVAMISGTAVSSFSASAWTKPANGYDAFLMCCSGEFADWCNQGPHGFVGEKGTGDNASRYRGGFGKDAVVTGDGQYTVGVYAPEGKPEGGDEYISGKIVDGLPTNLGFVYNGDAQTWSSFFAPDVFVIDIVGLIDGTEKYDSSTKTHIPNDAKSIKSQYDENAGAGPYKASQIKATVDSIKFDGVEAEFDASKIVTGNIEPDNYNYRIEIYNVYGSTKDNSPLINPVKDDIDAMTSVEITFTLSGLDGGSASTGTEASNTSNTTTGGNSGNNASQQTTTAAVSDSGTAATPSTSTGANTGATAGLALGGIALAGVAIVLAKKRK